jgi:hypothetical protein
VSSQHPKSWLERGHLRTIVCGGIVDSHASNLAVKVTIRDLWNALVGPVAGFEVHIGGPVVGLVFGERASRAICDLGNIGARYGGGESIAANDLVNVR